MIASFDIGEKNFAYSIGTRDELRCWRRHNVVVRKSQTILDSCEAISEILSSERDNWKDCSTIIIEQQVRGNLRAQRIAQHVWTWFRLSYPAATTQFIPASRKTQYFLGANTLSNRGRKKWAIDKVVEILRERNDDKNLEYFYSTDKRDDLADTYLQLMAYGR